MKLQLKVFAIKNKLFILILMTGFWVVPSIGFAQDDLLDDLTQEDSNAQAPIVNATFKTTRIINGHSIENTHHGVLDFRINHRFGPVNGGVYNLFGIDQASTRFGFEYGLTKDLTIGVGRSSYEKTYDGLIKYKFLRQRESGLNWLSAAVVSTISVNTLRWANPNRKNYFTSRLNYTYQLLLARKFSNSLSVQLTPTLVHRNLVSTFDEDNDVLAMGFGLIKKLTKRTSLNVEYFYAQKSSLLDRYKNSLSIGFDIETGGHVFQLHFTNSSPMIEKGFITETTQSWADGEFMFGFNVSRVFTLKSPDFEE